MPVERWTDERLDRLANLVESNARTAEANSNAVAEISREQAELARERNHMLGIIAQQQSDIRGMQTENRRILDILLNQQLGDSNNS
jgi:hypothetical protein